MVFKMSLTCSAIEKILNIKYVDYDWQFYEILADEYEIVDINNFLPKFIVFTIDGFR